MAFDPKQLERSFSFDPEKVASLRAGWSDLIVAVVWDDLRSGTIGTLPRLRKRVLELGENLRSVLSDRRWIPQERERVKRVKGAMAASLNLRDSLLEADRAAKAGLRGERFPALRGPLPGVPETPAGLPRDPRAALGRPAGEPLRHRRGGRRGRGRSC